MKSILIIIAVQFSFVHSLTAQQAVDELMDDSTKLYIEYADYQGYENDSIYTSLLIGSLFCGEKASVYVFQTRTPEEFYKSLRDPKNITYKNEKYNLKDEELLDMVVKSFNDKYYVEKFLSIIFIKKYEHPDYLQIKKLNEGDVWLSDMARFQWMPVNEFKIINGYKCQKATIINPDETEVIAWFTEDIPISSGPYYINGLPGLILEYYNSKTKRFFKTKTISSSNIPEQKFRKWLKGAVVTKTEYREIYDMGLKKFNQMKRMMETQKN